jgi:hypothetical protein
VQKEPATTGRRKWSPLKRSSIAGATVAVLALVGLLIVLLFPDSLINRFVKPRIVLAFAGAYPAYAIRIGELSYSAAENCLGVDSFTVSTGDGTFSVKAGPSSVTSIGWVHLLWGGSLRPADFAGASMDVHSIVVVSPQAQYELHCGLLHISVPDSVITLEDLELHPSAGDEEFFAASNFRRTRFRVAVPEVKAMGVGCLALLQGQQSSARSAIIGDARIDILIDKYKAVERDTARPLMPNDLLRLIARTITVDSVVLHNGGMLYGEQYRKASQPAVITLDSMQVSIRGIDIHPRDSGAVLIYADGDFMKSARMHLLMSIPLSSQEFSFHYSGALRGMDLSALNGFLETAEQMRITAGVLQGATFNINVAAGHASGNVRAVYRNLTLAVINRETGSAKGFADGIASFVANTFKIHGTNVPDRSGSLKIGEVKYVRHRQDPFFRFCWFALRSGVGDVVGF